MSFDLFDWLDEGARKAFTAAARHRRFSAGQLIYLQGDFGDEMFRIRSGSIRLSLMRDDGREVVFLFFQPGDCFGVSSLVDGQSRPQTAAALEDVTLDVLDISTFRQLKSSHTSFDDALFKLLAAQMRAATAHYANRSLDSLTSRVIDRILAAIPQSVPQPDNVCLPLTQSELALMVGASRQHVNRVLKNLEREKLLAVEYGKLLVLDTTRLAGRRTCSGSPA